MPRGNLVCRRDWYVLPDHLKQAYLDARKALETERSRRTIDALKTAKKNILDSINPGRNPSWPGE